MIDSLRRNNKLRDVANELAGKLDRSWGAIMNRARLVGQDLPEFQKASTRRRWTTEEDAYLRQHWEQQTLEELAEHLERSEGAVKMRLSELGSGQRRRRSPWVRLTRILKTSIIVITIEYFGPAVAPVGPDARV